jgi:hypothetical protein
LIGTVIGISHSKFVEFPGDMICCTGVCIPVGVNTIRGHGVDRSLFPHVGRIEPLEALENRVVRLAT